MQSVIGHLISWRNRFHTTDHHSYSGSAGWVACRLTPARWQFPSETAGSAVRGGVAAGRDAGQYTSWAFGQRLRTAGILGSMGSVGDAPGNALVESFFGSLQLELSDRRRWATPRRLAQAIFEYIEAWYNPQRLHSALGMPAPIASETRHAPTAVAA